MKKLIAIRIDEKYCDLIEKYSKLSKIDKTSIITRAIEVYISDINKYNKIFIDLEIAKLNKEKRELK